MSEPTKVKESVVVRPQRVEYQADWTFADALSEYADSLESERDRLREHIAELEVALRNLLDRVDRNGGLGEYKGGVPFVTKTARELLAKVSK